MHQTAMHHTVFPEMLMSRFRRFLSGFVSVVLLAGTPILASAQQQPPAPALAAKSWLLIEAGSGQTLAAQAADERLEPASLTKLMTAYLTFAALKQGVLKRDQSSHRVRKSAQGQPRRLAHVHQAGQAGHGARADPGHDRAVGQRCLHRARRTDRQLARSTSRRA